MKKLAIYETIIESEKGLYALSLLLLCFAVLIFSNFFYFSSAIGVLCVFYAMFILIFNLIKVREIVVGEETVEFISRLNKKSIKINELSEIKPIQSDKLRFVAYSNTITVSRAFTGMAELVVMLKAENPEAKISSI